MIQVASVSTGSIEVTTLCFMAAKVATDLILFDVKPTGREIGRGAYGRVFEVDYQGTLCAAKEVHELLLQYSQGNALRKITSDFLNECQICEQ